MLNLTFVAAVVCLSSVSGKVNLNWFQIIPKLVDSCVGIDNTRKLKLTWQVLFHFYGSSRFVWDRLVDGRDYALRFSFSKEDGKLN